MKMFNTLKKQEQSILEIVKYIEDKVNLEFKSSPVISEFIPLNDNHKKDNINFIYYLHYSYLVDIRIMNVNGCNTTLRASFYGNLMPNSVIKLAYIIFNIPQKNLLLRLEDIFAYNGTDMVIGEEAEMLISEELHKLLSLKETHMVQVDKYNQWREMQEVKRMPN